jgi:hypothetical protein
MVDPQHEGDRAKGQAVWSVQATKEMFSREIPEQKTVHLTLIPKFERGLRGFVEEIGRWRDASA